MFTGKFNVGNSTFRTLTSLLIGDSTSMSTLFCSGCERRLTGTLTSKDQASPTPQLFGTNEAPSSVEAHAIREYLLDIEGEIEQMQSQILQVQSILAGLQSKREKLKSFAHKHRRLLSPLRRLFPELLSEIFSWCPKGAPAQYTIAQIPDSFHPHCGPLLLSQICRPWRSAAIATPKLWTTIRLVLRPRSKLRVTLLDLFLSRSGDCDLIIGVVDDLNISDQGATGLAAHSFHLSELRILARQAHRWKSAFFSLPPYQIYWDALSEAKGKTNRLDQLGLFSQSSRSEGPVVDIFTNSPQLASLSLDSCVSMSDLLVDKSKITRFRYEKPAVPLDRCVEAMRSLPNLEHCVLYCLVLALNSSTVPPIFLHNLRYLDIRIDFGPHAHRGQPSAFWDALQIPNLSSLRVKAWYHSPVQISHLFRRCQNLKKLTIIWKGAEAEQLLETIQHATAITSLSLGLDKENFLQVLSSLASTDETTSSQLLLPGLKEIRIYPVEIENFLDFCNDGTVRLSSEFLKAFIQLAHARMTARNSGIALLDTASLHHPAHSEAAVEVVNRYMHAMGSQTSGQSPFPVQVYYSKLSGGSGGIVKMQRSSL